MDGEVTGAIVEDEGNVGAEVGEGRGTRGNERTAIAFKNKSLANRCTLGGCQPHSFRVTNGSDRVLHLLSQEGSLKNLKLNVKAKVENQDDKCPMKKPSLHAQGFEDDRCISGGQTAPIGQTCLHGHHRECCAEECPMKKPYLYAHCFMNKNGKVVVSRVRRVWGCRGQRVGEAAHPGPGETEQQFHERRMDKALGEMQQEIAEGMKSSHENWEGDDMDIKRDTTGCRISTQNFERKFYGDEEIIIETIERMEKMQINIMIITEPGKPSYFNQARAKSQGIWI